MEKLFVLVSVYLLSLPPVWVGLFLLSGDLPSVGMVLGVGACLFLTALLFAIVRAVLDQ